MKLHSFKLPAPLICDDALSYSARRVGAVLFGHRNRFGLCHKGLILLAKYSRCSVSTVRKAVEELERAGYITSYHNHKYSLEQGRVVYDRNSYVCNLSFRGGFTMVPRHILDWDLTAGAFSVCLYLCYQAGSGSRAFPSLRKIGKMLGMSHATVCRAVAALKQLRGMLVLACVKVNRAFSSNSYYFVTEAKCALERIAEKLKNTFLCHYSTSGRDAMQSRSDSHGGLILSKLLWDLDNGSIRRGKESRGGCA